MILAGGQGHRFGRPKATAVLPDGRTFLEACADALAGAGVAPVVATLPPEFDGPVPAGVAALVLPTSGLAMFDSLRLALGAAVAQPCWRVAVIHPVDHPLVRASTVRALVAALSGVGAPDVARPSAAGKHGHPLALRRDVCERIVDGRLPGPTLREVVHAVTASDVGVDDEGVTANCNSPERLAQAWLASAAPR